MTWLTKNENMRNRGPGLAKHITFVSAAFDTLREAFDCYFVKQNVDCISKAVMIGCLILMVW